MTIMDNLRRILFTAALLLAMPGGNAHAGEYKIDVDGAHASINFAIPHLGFSILTGRFDTFSGYFIFDPKQPEKSYVEVEIDAASINSNHAERDRRLRGKNFLYVSKFPKASFKSTKIVVKDEKTGVIEGDFTLRGVTRKIRIDATHVGGGKDPWGGYRDGFTGKAKIALKDYGIDFDLGPFSKEVELTLHIEGVKAW